MQPHRVFLAGSHRSLPADAQVIGPIDPARPMEVTVRVRPHPHPGNPTDPRNPLNPGPFLPAAEPTGLLPLRERQHLSRAEFEALHGADPADLEAVEAFAHEHGLSVVEQSPARRSVSLAGTAAAMSAAFGVTLQHYTHPRGDFRGHGGAVQIPGNLQPIVEGVFGLDDRPQARPHFRVHKPAPGSVKKYAFEWEHLGDMPPEMPPEEKDSWSGAPGSGPTGGGYTPVQVARAYDFPSGNANDQCIALIELGGGYRTADLNAYFAKLDWKTPPRVSAVSVDGGRNQPTGDPEGPDGEVMLDIEVAAAVAPGAQVVVYFAPNTDRGFLDAVTTAIHDGFRKPSVLSISWGSAETNWTQQAMAAMDQAFQAAAAMGITICAASGDNGSTDGEPGAKANVDFPASSPHVLACGGTRLFIAPGPPGSPGARPIPGISSGGGVNWETVWNDGVDGGASGGGISSFFGKPAWQLDAGVPPSVNPGERIGRGVPDVCGSAEPLHGYLVRIDGSDMVIGGTSAVAPLWAGLVALMNQSLGHRAGYLNPILYQRARDGGLYDVLQGDNGQYEAGPGWDACTGLGSPRGRDLLQILSCPQLPQKPAA